MVRIGGLVGAACLFAVVTRRLITARRRSDGSRDGRERRDRDALRDIRDPADTQRQGSDPAIR